MDYATQRTKAQGGVEAVQARFKNGDLSKNQYEQDYSAAIAELRGLHDNVLNKVHSERDSYYAAVDAWEAPAGDKVHDDIKVLSGLVPLSLKDIESLGEKHKDNPVMTKAILKYAKDNGLDYYSIAPTGDTKRQAMEDFCRYAESAIDDSTSLYSAMMADDNHFDKICDSALNSSGEA